MYVTSTQLMSIAIFMYADTTMSGSESDEGAPELPIDVDPDIDDDPISDTTPRAEDSGEIPVDLETRSSSEGTIYIV